MSVFNPLIDYSHTLMAPKGKHTYIFKEQADCLSVKMSV